MCRAFAFTIAATITAFAMAVQPALAEIMSLNDLPRVERKSLGSTKTPWSRPIMVYDSFTEESFPAVMDVNYRGNELLIGEENGIVTMWTLSGIKAAYYYRNKAGEVGAFLNDGLQIKVDGKVYTAPPITNSMYPITPELHQALMQSSGKVFVRALHNGKQFDSEIGRGTIKAYQELGAYFSRQQP
jgi:hypothetical protein